MIVILGDLHFSSAKDYFIAVGNAILEWFEAWAYNKAGNELILAGDIVHSSVNGGLVISMVEKLICSSRFDKVHIVVGNHDVKRRDGCVQLAYEFLRDRPNVVIYDRATVASIQGKKVLMLPHFMPELAEKSMPEQYSAISDTFKDRYDLTVGHFMEETMSFGASDAIKNISKLNTKHLCLGHLHTRSDPRIYIGSVYANKVNEADSTRAAWIIDETGQRSEDPLPTFCEYISVRYPDEPAKVTAKVVAYTISNCTSERLARRRYGEAIFIRKLINTLSTSASSQSSELEAADTLDPSQLFREFVKARPESLDRRVATLCASLLKKPTNLGYDNGNSSPKIL